MEEKGERKEERGERGEERGETTDDRRETREREWERNMSGSINNFKRRSHPAKGKEGGELFSSLSLSLSLPLSLSLSRGT